MPGRRRAEPRRAGAPGVKTLPTAAENLAELPEFKEWRGGTLQTRTRRMLAIIEAIGAAGDADCAKAALMHYRWEKEMSAGRARQQAPPNAGVQIVIVNGIAGSPTVIDAQPAPDHNILRSAGLDTSSEEEEAE